MTTPPEAKLFHTRRDEAVVRPAGTGMRVEVARRERPRAPESAPQPSEADAQSLLVGDTDDGFGGMSLFDKPKAEVAETDKAPDAPAEDGALAGEALAAAIAAVTAEALAPRQLRVAERIAALHQITAASPEEAVAQLRHRGIDPFARGALRKAVAEEGARSSAQPARNVPSVVEADRQTLPAPRQQPPVPGPARKRGQVPGEVMTEERRAQEIFAIQRDIARRRRRRLGFLLARLTAFVFIPSIVTGWYYLTQATPLYATYSQFQIQHANSGGSAGGLGSLFSGSQLATNPESVAVQSYLTSRDAMLRLDQDMGFKRAFQDPAIDPLTRLDPDASNETAYGVYKSSVKIGYDPTEGVINMEVIAPDPQLSRQFSLALIDYAEAQVDQMTARLRSDQLASARANYDDAEARVLDAQRRVQALQQQMGILDPAAESGAVLARIGAMEGELVQKRLELGTLKSNARPNASRVDALEGEIARLEALIADTRLQLTESTDARNSLAEVSGELRMAEGELSTRQQLLASALAELEAARIEAGKQVRYLTLSVAPVAPDEATYPRAYQNTFVAFLIFSGIYLMISLTVSILREQVSS